MTTLANENPIKIEMTRDDVLCGPVNNANGARLTHGDVTVYVYANEGGYLAIAFVGSNRAPSSLHSQRWGDVYAATGDAQRWIAERAGITSEPGRCDACGDYFNDYGQCECPDHNAARVKALAAARAAARKG
jgi:hypothetical protein